MTMARSMRVPIILACSATVLFYLVNRAILSIGQIVFHFFPYKQDPMTSYPPYAIFDLIFLGICAVVFFLSLAVLLYRVVMFFFKKPRVEV
jgi:hypothetical protein